MKTGRIAVALGSCALAVAFAAACERAAVADSIAPAELAERIEAGNAPVVLDVRTREEFDAGHIPGAVLIPHDELGPRVDELSWPRDAEIVVHCQSGRRAELAEAVLRDAGYTRVRDLDGHWQAWREGGHPVED